MSNTYPNGYLAYPNPAPSGGSGGGISSINGDTTAAQVITGIPGITAITATGTTTIGLTTYAPICVAKSGTIPASAPKVMMFGNNVFLTIDEFGRSYYSADAVSWIEGAQLTDTIANPLTWAVGGGFFLINGYEAGLWALDIAEYNSNNVGWLQPSSNPVDALAIAFGNVSGGFGIFVAVGSAGNTGYAGNPFNAWTNSTNLPTADDYSAIIYAPSDGAFVAVAKNSSTAWGYTFDGATWTAGTGDLPITAVNPVLISGPIGIDLALMFDADTATDLYGYIITPASGSTWNNGTMPSVQKWIGGAYDPINNYFFVLAQDSNVAAFSPDGITWTQITLPITDSWLTPVYGNSIFVAPSITEDQALVYAYIATVAAIDNKPGNNQLATIADVESILQIQNANPSIVDNIMPFQVLDASGANLIISTNFAYAWMVGNMVFFTLNVTFPSTINTNQALLGGLPGTAIFGWNANYQASAASIATAAVARINQGTPNISILNASSLAPLTNNMLSNGTFTISGFYAT